MKTAGIVGLGLIGGSLAKALKYKGGFSRIVACDSSPETLRQAAAEGIADICADSPSDCFKSCEIIFICTPAALVPAMLKQLEPFLNKGVIVTDVSSTKGAVMRDTRIEGGASFIGGHPMAGSEKSGYRASREYLFENAYYVLTPGENAKEEHITVLSEIVKKIGAIPLILGADEHDRAVAAISHAPHVVASALVNAVKSLDGSSQHMHMLAAGGFKDITRVASSDPGLWSSICSENKEEILKVISIFKEELGRFEADILGGQEELYSLFEQSRNYRNSFSEKVSRLFEIKVDMEDKPGMIATVATMLSLNNINIKNIGIVNNREYENGVLQIVFDTGESMKRSVKLLREMNFTVYER